MKLRQEILFIVLSAVALIASCLPRYWPNWPTVFPIVAGLLLVVHASTMSIVKSSGATTVSWPEIVVMALAIALLAGILGSSFVVVIVDAVEWAFLDAARPADTRAGVGVALVALLAIYLDFLKRNIRCSYGAVEIAGAIAVAVLTARVGSGAAPTAPLYLLGFLAGALLVVQGLENIRVGMSGKDDVGMAKLLNASAPAAPSA